MKKDEKKKIFKSPISSYKRNKKTLIPPLNSIGEHTQIFFRRDILPELLWLEALTSHFGESEGHRICNSFADEFDKYYKPANTKFFDGSISNFNLIAYSRRAKFIEENRLLIETAVVKPFGDIIRLYPKVPMKWLLVETEKTTQKYKAKAIDRLRASVMRLFPAKDDYAGNIRAMPLNRIFKWGKITIGAHMKEIIKAIEEYPRGDRYRLQSFARTTYNMYQQHYIKNKKWAEYFWNYNYSLVNNCNE